MKKDITKLKTPEGITAEDPKVIPNCYEKFLQPALHLSKPAIS